MKGQKTRLADRLGAGCKRKKGVKEDSKVSIPRRSEVLFIEIWRTPKGTDVHGVGGRG